MEEREKLTERLKELENRLIDKDNEYKLLSRRLQLEAKGYKTQLVAEHQKYKELTTKYDKLTSEVNRLNDIIEVIIFNFIY